MSIDDLFETTEAPKKWTLNRLPSHEDLQTKGRFPRWLHRKVPKKSAFFTTSSVLNSHRLSLVCEEARCPNQLECYSKKTATFLALGSHCTRRCGFCDISFSEKPPALDADEPERIASAAKELGLKHVVITMVTRDDLPDGGAKQIAAILRAVRKESPSSSLEVLTSDFGGNRAALDLVLQEKPEIFNHNLETVRSLTPRVRHKATYDLSLSTLRYVKDSKACRFVKSGMMAGLGESSEEILSSIRDLHQAGCDIITVGQYLQASRNNLLVKRFVTPEEFQSYIRAAQDLGVPYTYAAPFVRSSYNAHEIYHILNRSERDL